MNTRRNISRNSCDSRSFCTVCPILTRALLRITAIGLLRMNIVAAGHLKRITSSLGHHRPPCWNFCPYPSNPTSSPTSYPFCISRSLSVSWTPDPGPHDSTLLPSI
ncbi:hypothetical protein K469DRAFT_703329 [Zopfia rhizophila CBS 207.26]|uniref:Uncharacterized protein n=1 Tax=Zopfia rhizophila CBS 207.26 TaxID=1314779 RepID=A0A6A6EA83_9PEZI|nr:hypothetical protein K469DRAFT_703329 [Zopfia rhizophila CBS 207.26]